MTATIADPRTIFLSHRSDMKPKVRRLAADLAAAGSGPPITIWFDEAEIRVGESIPAAVNRGLENSRWFGLLMSPSYFENRSGWTDAEWHAVFHQDPDNRSRRIVPILLEDCPRIPILLGHLRRIDLRDDNYATGLEELVSAVRSPP